MDSTFFKKIFQKNGVLLNRCNPKVKTSVLLICLSAILFSISFITLKGRPFSDTVGRWIQDSLHNHIPTKQFALLVTYGRSGSSFTSALIAYPNNSFFLFEPLWILGKLNNSENASMAVLESFMNCNITLQKAYLINNNLFGMSQKTSGFWKCFSKQDTGLSHVMCFLQFLDECQSKQFWFAKTIRFRVRWAEKFLENLPTFKIIYLIRDPRATLFSQAMNFGFFNWTNELVNASKEHCSLVEGDIIAIEILAKKFKNRIKCLRYEDVTSDPFTQTQNIYSFLGLNYSREIEDYIVNITRGRNMSADNGDAYSIVRENSVVTMNKWRTLVNYSSVQIVDEMCGSLYPKLGYKFVQSETELKGIDSLFTRPQSDLFVGDL